jgi:hypothetical protein
MAYMVEKKKYQVHESPIIERSQDSSGNEISKYLRR